MQCDCCKLVFVDKLFLPDGQDEKERYILHNNSLDDAGYVNFLYQAIAPALNYISAGMSGLDYGCGPSPTLSILMEREKFSCQNYDPFFFPELPDGPFDFVFATECFEHFFSPGNELHILTSLIKPGGLLIVMTNLWNSFQQFQNWQYARDFTHVSFYHADTFEFICRKYGLKLLEMKNNRVIILRRR